ncbi:MAG: hypothetical protein O3A46_16365, partial [Candidatus Poribacteria bacterium]|nr:hypothetical protein [Candidatus Poribacteria bacterium]
MRYGWLGFLCVVGLIPLTVAAEAQRQMENLGRGVVAVREADGSVFIGWRLLGTDPDDIAFNLYRRADEDGWIKVNDRPIADRTHFIDGNADST